MQYMQITNWIERDGTVGTSPLVGRLSKAFAFAHEAHAGQKRKSTGEPYAGHVLRVAFILAAHNCDEEIVAAGVLHDAIEDGQINGKPVTFGELVTQFGGRIAGCVQDVTEKKLDDQGNKRPWKVRKQECIDHLRAGASWPALAVKVADHLDNLQETARGMTLAKYGGPAGEDYWRSFNADKASQAWYSRGIFNSVLARLDSALGTPEGICTGLRYSVHQMVQQLATLIQAVHG